MLWRRTLRIVYSLYEHLPLGCVWVFFSKINGELMSHIRNMKMSYPFESLIFPAKWDTGLTNNVIVNTLVLFYYSYWSLTTRVTYFGKYTVCPKKSSNPTLVVKLGKCKSMTRVCLSFMVLEQNIRTAI